MYLVRSASYAWEQFIVVYMRRIPNKESIISTALSSIKRGKASLKGYFDSYQNLHIRGLNLNGDLK